MSLTPGLCRSDDTAMGSKASQTKWVLMLQGGGECVSSKCGSKVRMKQRHHRDRNVLASPPFYALTTPPTPMPQLV